MPSAITIMSGRPLHLIVGLGNPGSAYARSRHNIGFLVIDRLAGRFGLKLQAERFAAEIAMGAIADRAVMAVKPLSYMNRCGPAVAQIIRTYGIQCEDMIVVHDDIDLAYERLKIKEKGGDGGHNGVRSLIDAVGTDRLVRVRMGVGRPPADCGVVEFVLGEFGADQRATLDPFLETAVDAVSVILSEGTREAMSRFNRKA